MSAREVERILEQTGGRLCARATFAQDGSLNTLEEPGRSPAASFVLAAALAFTTPIAARGQNAAATPVEAHLTGVVKTPDGKKPVSGGTVVLLAEGRTVASATTNAEGAFSIAAQPGRYDIAIRQNVMFGLSILAADLHAGEQTVNVVHTRFDYNATGNEALGGAMVAVIRYSPTYLFKHPIRYLKNFRHNF